MAADEETIAAAVKAARTEDLGGGEERAGEVDEYFEVCFAWKGNLEYNDLVFDRRE